MSVCVFCLSYLVCKSHPFCAIYCQLQVARLYQSSTLSHKRYDFRKKFSELKMCVLIFSTPSVRIFFSFYEEFSEILP